MKEDSFPGTFTKQQAYFIFTLLFLLYMFDYIDRMVIVSLFPYIKQDWGLSDAQCGLMVSVVYWSILLFTLPASFAIDRWSRKKVSGLCRCFGVWLHWPVPRQATSGSSLRCVPLSASEKRDTLRVEQR